IVEFEIVVFFFQAEDGIRDRNVTGVQTCALPILERSYEVTLSAPTGRAAKRLEQSCKVPAKTIHRLLGYKPVDEGRGMFFDFNRSEERRVGKECRSRW